MADSDLAKELKKLAKRAEQIAKGKKNYKHKRHYLRISQKRDPHPKRVG